jgi:hypothetical protein
MPKATPQHTWLQQTVGDWVTETEAIQGPGQPMQKSKGIEHVEALGSFWTVSQMKGHMMGMPFSGQMTMGYDADKKQYLATWIDSMMGKPWHYTGNVDATGKMLTLETTGMCPMQNKPVKFKDTLELVSPNHKVYTSRMQGEDGKWITVMTSHAERITPATP